PCGSSLLTLGPLLPLPFPYTTLFRSLRPIPLRQPLPLLADAAEQRPARRRRRLVVRQPRHRRRQIRILQPHLRAIAAGEELHRQDRKSTRLNSSHVSISYAVFCLKKK